MRTKLLFVSLALAAATLPLAAQQGGQAPPRQPPPLFAALDANHDGVIDAAEIANAPAALRTLDKNGDGKLTMDEIRPPRPGGGPGGAGGQPPDGARPDRP